MCERMARTGFEVLFEFQSPGFVRESHVPGKVQRNEAQRRWSTPTIVLIKPPPQIPRKPNVPKLGMSPTSEAIDIVHVFLFIYFYLFSISILRSVGAKSPRLRASADLTRESHSDFAAPPRAAPLRRRLRRAPSFAPLTKKPPARRFFSLSLGVPSEAPKERNRLGCAPAPTSQGSHSDITLPPRASPPFAEGFGGRHPSLYLRKNRRLGGSLFSSTWRAIRSSNGAKDGGMDGTRTRGLLRDRQTL